jgi:hypothetical protein
LLKKGDSQSGNCGQKEGTDSSHGPLTS